MPTQRKPGSASPEEPTRNRGTATPPEVVSLIGVLARMGRTTQEISLELDRRFPYNAPALRTIQSIVRNFKANPERWNPRGTDPKGIYEVLGDVIRVTAGKKMDFTQDEADAVRWVRDAVPELPAYYVWVLACLYLNEESKKAGDFGPLNAFIALKPWESLEKMTEFIDLVEGQVLPQGLTVINVASEVRQVFYKQENEIELEALRRRARAGDADAIMAMALVQPEERRNRGSQEILADFQAQGYEIDEGHASLGMVYTNQEETEVNEEG